MSFIQPATCDDAQIVLEETGSFFILIPGGEESTTGVLENNLVFSKYGFGLADICVATHQVISQRQVTAVQALQFYDKQYPESFPYDLEQKLTHALKLCFS